MRGFDGAVSSAWRQAGEPPIFHYNPYGPVVPPDNFRPSGHSTGHSEQYNLKTYEVAGTANLQFPNSLAGQRLAALTGRGVFRGGGRVVQLQPTALLDEARWEYAKSLGGDPFMSPRALDFYVGRPASIAAKVFHGLEKKERPTLRVNGRASTRTAVLSACALRFRL